MKQGTKEEFREWLLSMKRITYTKYSALPIERKAEIQKEYANKYKQTCKSTVIVTEPAKVEE